MNKILSLPIRSVCEKFINGELRPSELRATTVKLSEAIKPLNAYINVTNQLSEQQSKDSDERYAKQNSTCELDGIPIAIKDNFCVEGQPTTCASLMLANFVPGYNATVYNRLRKNGAVLMGKTNLDQFAMGSGTVDSYYGPTKNIWGSKLQKYYDYHESIPETSVSVGEDDWFIAGGSSGGSAVAVASGTCYAALGSDTGGSTRNPASYCGLVGLKPSYGLVSRHGLIPLVNSMDVPGILARTVDDSLSVLNAIAGPDESDSTTLQEEYEPFDLPNLQSLQGLRIGIPKEYHPAELSDEISSCWQRITRLMEESGAIIVPCSMPHTQWSIVCYSILNQCEVASNMARYDGIEYGYRADEDSSTEELYAKTRSLGFNDVVRSRILTGNYFLLAENYDDYFVKAMKIRRLIAQDFDNAWNSNVDILLTPTTLSDAPLYKDYIKSDNQAQCSVQDFCTQPANMAGIPALSIPVEISRRGLPLSLQLMAPYLHEKRLLLTAKWIEQTVQFPRMRLKDSSLLK
ncbi:glutamyl-tRNA(Gln) amidotransferase subunit A, mitochondrial [Venturia canescens]|uniref:glutamyl-tRNA(Gln) amidotransferase subunit A, mitochondrial n=1 Tax=Venturia canescens TaxID=32260 RepID=UPI001C9CF307|nr:glutamyl-tRNA(Gln) amidotransferase subunit A, mitochondrial [Venturia canescens]